MSSSNQQADNKKDIACFTEYYEDNMHPFPPNLANRKANIKVEGEHSTVFLTPPKSHASFMAIKLFNDTYFKPNDQISFLKQISEMAFLQHPCLAELKRYNFSRRLNLLGEKTSNTQPYPILATARYTPFNEMPLDKFQDPLQLFIFVYGYCRAFRFLNAFHHSSDSVHTDHIFFCKQSESELFPNFDADDKYSYPIVSFFCTGESLHEAATLSERKSNISKHLSSFCKFIQDLLSKSKIGNDSHPYSIFFDTFQNIESTLGFSNAVSILENKVYKIIKAQCDTEVFEKYKAFLDDYEFVNFQLKDSDQLSQVESIINSDNFSNRYRAEREILKLAQEGNPEACLRIAIDYYLGSILPKDLVLSIRFLLFSIRHFNNPAAEVLLNSLFVTSQKTKIIPPSEEAYQQQIQNFKQFRNFSDRTGSTQSDCPNLYDIIIDRFKTNLEYFESSDYVNYDPQALFYMGAFYEAFTRQDFNFTTNETNKCRQFAVNCYMESIKQKPKKEVIGRLGGILANCPQTEYKKKGIQLINKAAGMGDIYSKVLKGKYDLDNMNSSILSNQEQIEAIEAILPTFYDLEALGYLDASSTIGFLYVKMYQLALMEQEMPHMHKHKRNAKRKGAVKSATSSKSNEYLKKAISYYTKACEIYGDELAQEKCVQLQNELQTE